MVHYCTDIAFITVLLSPSTAMPRYSKAWHTATVPQGTVYIIKFVFPIITAKASKLQTKLIPEKSFLRKTSYMACPAPVPFFLSVFFLSVFLSNPTATLFNSMQMPSMLSSGLSHCDHCNARLLCYTILLFKTNCCISI